MSQTEASNESARQFHAARLIDLLMARTAIALAMNTGPPTVPATRLCGLVEACGEVLVISTLMTRPCGPRSTDFARRSPHPQIAARSGMGGEHDLFDLAGELLQREGLGQEVDVAVAVEAFPEGVFGVAGDEDNLHVGMQ